MSKEKMSKIGFGIFAVGAVATIGSAIYWRLIAGDKYDHKKEMITTWTGVALAWTGVIISSLNREKTT